MIARVNVLGKSNYISSSFRLATINPSIVFFLTLLVPWIVIRIRLVSLPSTASVFADFSLTNVPPLALSSKA